MKPSEQCKQAGLDSLAELSEYTGKPVQTLIRWAKDAPGFFELLVYGAMVVKNRNEEREARYQEMMLGIMNGDSVAHILGYDWVFGLPPSPDKTFRLQRAKEVFVKQYGDPTAYSKHQPVEV